MGVAKERFTIQQEQGWYFVDGKSTCDECVEEPILKQWIRSQANEHTCSYCGRTSDEMYLAVCVNDLFTFINKGLRFEYGDAVDLLPYDSKEKRLIGEWLDSDDIASDFELFSNDDLRQAFIVSFADRMFCRSNPFVSSESESFMYGWERFVNHVKHRSRYYFLVDPEAEQRNGPWLEDRLNVNQVPTYLGEVVRELDLVREVEAGEFLFRARLSKEGRTYSSATELGTVPTKHAYAANRMSPAGIAMFYAAEDEISAIAEVYEETKDKMQMARASVGLFSATRSLCLVDLSGQVSLHSLFDAENRHLREKVRLLREFAKQIAQPVQKDGLEHIEYTPTQIVTEYFRHVFTTKDSRPIDGLMYKSSKTSSRLCYVLFAENEHCVDQGTPSKNGETELLLTLNDVRTFGPGLAQILSKQ